MISYLAGLVFDTESKLPVEANIAIFALRDTSENYQYRARADGTFTAALAHGQPYGVHVTASAYTFFSLQFEFDSVQPYGSEELRIPLQRIVEDVKTPRVPIVLQNVEFKSASATLLSSSIPELELLLGLLDENPEIRIRILGHTDNIGEPNANQKLSEQRARAVYDWLLQMQVSSERVSFKGLGETMPIDSNETEEGRQRNRRTEFVVEN